ncbi:predicted protein [Meyerozyma guilliermondii ATCC 6260]|uniref:Uncharacterized protein n=1 Tax=Meyerozyma guilliermondii (strain ATCC 6260 / CBS 566 / DSM 6381 / JCM 1539 / NBRC 10279 / NRRL Y-324) TaxID=294746 RepID=A5DK03_PICGU|nr:uncharacterized protein PGUG_03604 [Meyerozyma guilliermondii ATCC 6260]EDK39506.2 predicted protein [Meyerozyma guilliermondii ATCC 6260]
MGMSSGDPRTRKIDECRAFNKETSIDLRKTLTTKRLAISVPMTSGCQLVDQMGIRGQRAADAAQQLAHLASDACTHAAEIMHEIYPMRHSLDRNSRVGGVVQVVSPRHCARLGENQNFCGVHPNIFYFSSIDIYRTTGFRRFIQFFLPFIFHGY